MDFSPTGWIARYSTVPVYRLIESWSEEGVAQVVDEQQGKLVAASLFSGFAGLERVGKVAALAVAEPGWQLQVWGSDAPEDTFVEPIAAWLADTEGNVYPIGGTNDTSLTAIGSNQRSTILPPGETASDLP